MAEVGNMRCPSCGKQNTVIEIRMRIADEDVSFQRCGFCEAKVWERGGEGAVSLDGVLELARTSR
jgi:hypothetical protein